MDKVECVFFHNSGLIEEFEVNIAQFEIIVFTSDGSFATNDAIFCITFLRVLRFFFRFI